MIDVLTLNLTLIFVEKSVEKFNLTVENFPFFTINNFVIENFALTKLTKKLIYDKSNYKDIEYFKLI
ncbi:MAG: hypothetical protein AB4080_11300 [Trichodesmium sp.]